MEPWSSPCSRTTRRQRPNQTVQRMGASRFVQRQIQRHRCLMPVADLCVSCRFARMSKRTLIMAGFFAIVIGMLEWVAFQPKEPKAAVTFLGYTNDASGTRLATFVVSNLNSFVVRRQAGYWIDLPTPTGETKQASCWFSNGNDLNAGAFEMIAVRVL